MSVETLSSPLTVAGDAEATEPSLPSTSDHKAIKANALVGLALAYGGGIGLLVASYHAAAFGRGSLVTFGLFWAGILTPFLATVAALGFTRLTSGAQVGLVAALGVFGTLPKLLRTPGGPLYFDELAHWRQAHDVATSGRLGQPNGLLKALADFPGLHALTASLERLTGLSTWVVALAVVIVAHALALVAVYCLVVAVLSDHRGASPAWTERVAALTAVFYATNSGWLYFDSQFAYQTLAIPFVLAAWTLAVSASAMSAPRGGGKGARLAALCFIAFATAVVHHASAMMLVLGLVGHALIRGLWVRRERRAARTVQPGQVLTAWLAVFCGFGASLVWLARSWSMLVHYLGPYVTTGFTQLTGLTDKLFGRKGGGGEGSHTLFHGSSLPRFELIAAFVAPALVGLVAAALVLSRIRSRRVRSSSFKLGDSPGAVMMAAVAGLYFASLPMLLTSGGNETARRSWTYTSVGLAFVLAVGVVEILSSWDGWRRSVRAAVGLALAASLIVVTVGNVAAGQNEAYRFPGAREQGSDSRGVDAEGLAVAKWMAANAPMNSWTITDRFTASLVATLGQQRLLIPWTGQPTWELVSARALDNRFTSQLIDSNVDYLVLDSRMTALPPALGFWFERNEPDAVHDAPTAVAAVRRFDCVPWASAVLSTEHYTVYRLDTLRFDADSLNDTTAALAARAGQGDNVAGLSAVDGVWPALSAKALSVLTERRCG
jgi:hypothetical protein